jgi:multimeric flavodoxin WrbA
MSILVVWASPNQDGLTAAAKDSVIEGIKSAGAESESLHLNKYNISNCLACEDGWGLCRSQGNCVMQDDFFTIYSKFVVADGIVLVTPVYWHDLAENLKCLLDRMRRCETAYSHHLQGKKALLIACAGGTGLGAIQCLHSMEETITHMGMKALDRLPVIQFNREYMFPALMGAGQAFGAYMLA